jgi:signal transduction histidine kinase/CheY-like chemotaxis protein
VALQTNDQLDALIRALPQIVIYLDAEGVVIRHNHNLSELLAVGVENIAGELLIDYLHPWSDADALELRSFLSLPLAEGEDIRMEYAVSLKTSWSSRGIFRAELQSAEGPEGSGSEYLLILEDVTNLRQMEEEYRRVQRIQSLLPLVRGFGADFRDRLTVIFGNLDYVLELMKRDGPDLESQTGAIRDSLGSAIKHLERSNGRLDNILWLAGGGRRSMGEFSLADAVREVGDQAILGSNKTLDVIVENDIPPYRGDYEKILQMFQNILVNAVQAGPDPYPVTVSLELVNRNGRDAVLISVSDHGEGMSLDVLSRAEQPFFTTRDNADGLGLFIAKNIALEHAGSLELESTSGRGSKIHVFLPLASGDVPMDTVRKIPEGLKLMILDDNPDVQEIWERLLYQMGIHGSFVHSSAQAFEQFEKASDSDYPFHMVILEDSESDSPDVFSLLGRLRAIHPDLPAVYTSSRSVSPGIDELKEKGFSAYLRKPFRLFDLQNALLKALYQERQD